MKFKDIGKYVIIAILVIGVSGLVYTYFIHPEFPGDKFKLGNSDSMIDASDDFNRINLPRLFLLMWETFWLTTIALFFFFVSTRAKTPENNENEHAIEAFEPKLFKIVVIFLIVAAILTLLLPAFIGPGLTHYRTTNEGTDLEVIARQYSYRIDGNACVSGVSCITLNAGQAYAFNLESGDTTHGFAIYDADSILLLQAQIVPGYITRLVNTFEPGVYIIRCSEFCSQGHHNMNTMFTVA